MYVLYIMEFKEPTFVYLIGIVNRLLLLYNPITDTQYETQFLRVWPLFSQTSGQNTQSIHFTWRFANYKNYFNYMWVT